MWTLARAAARSMALNGAAAVLGPKPTTLYGKDAKTQYFPGDDE